MSNSQNHTFWLYILGLIFIFLFASFLRYEDFPIWKKNKAQFQYQGEYQMANFDSYYYLQIAKELKEGSYDSIQENRRVPNGMKAPALPPLISVLAVSISNLTSIPLSTVAIFLPIFLASLLAPVVFIVSIGLRFNKIAALIAALFSIISINYVVRTRIGVFDTDCLNVIFVLLNSYLFFQFAEVKSNKRYLYLLLGLVNSFLFYAWWNTASSIVVLSAVIPLSTALIFFYKTKNNLLKYSVVALIFLISTYFIKEQLVHLYHLFLGKIDTAFPTNLSVSELNGVGISDFIKLTSNNTLIFLCMLVGLFALCWKLKLKTLFFALPIVLTFIAFFAGNRFALFAAPVLALGMGYFVQILFNYKKTIKPKLAIGIAVLLSTIGIASCYGKLTDNYEKPAAFENVALLNALKKHTPNDASIWTGWDLGYQIQYYLDRGTYADGEFSDGEIYYYTSFPLAVDNLKVSANFMRFYNKHGIKGMEVLYGAFVDLEKTFEFLKIVFAYSPSEAEKWLMSLQQQNLLPKTNRAETPKQWVSFLFPRQSDDIYLFIHYKMTQTAAWFKQGNSDLKTGETIGLPLFLTFNSLKQEGNQIKNHQMSLDQNSGVMNYYKQKRYFQSLATFTGDTIKRKSFTTSKLFQKDGKNNPFVFQWNQEVGFGAAMSKEMANTSLVKLYLLQEKSPHFQPVFIDTPRYQIWKVTGNAYEIE